MKLVRSREARKRFLECGERLRFIPGTTENYWRILNRELT